MNVRDKFFNAVYERTCEGKDIVVVSSDLGAPSLDDFRRDFPQRFVNVGIAEQNAIAVAAGLSLANKTAITYGLNPFPVTRSFDHIRNLMASLKIPITVACLKAGTCTAEAGFSHMAIENLSLLRTLHNIQIIAPSDETISRKLVDEIIGKPFPRYVQFDPFIHGKLYDDAEIDFEKGFSVSNSCNNVAIVTYGVWAHEIKKEELPAKLIDCFALPVDASLFISEIKECEKIITIEDGVESGGIGSMVLELLNEYGLHNPVKRMALKFCQGYPQVFTDRKTIFEEEALTLNALRRELEG